MTDAPPRTRGALARRVGAVLALGLVTLALGLRLPWLDSMPNPTGDEGNWLWISFDLAQGRPAVLPPDARFVSLAFARLIALAYTLLGPTFASARAVCVAGIALGALGSYLACARMGARRAGLAVAALLAVHPWSVLWSRTVTVPYALSLALATAGPLVALAAWRERSPRVRAVLTFVAVQLLFVGLHFSPLALAALGFCAIAFVLRARRAKKLAVGPLVFSTVLGVLHTAPVVLGALHVAAAGTTRPNHQFDRLGLRLFTYARTVADGFAGESTLRYFTGRELSPALELVVAIAALGVPLALAMDTPQGDTRREDTPRSLRGLALGYLGFSLVVVPCLLAPARPWSLPAVDAERYLFALLAPFALCVGALAESRVRFGRAAAGAFVLYLLCGPTARAAGYFLAGGGPDRGFWLLDGGGGYRGWKTDRERVAIPWLIQREVARVTHGAPATIVVPDYAFHALHFANARTPWPTTDVRGFDPARVTPGERYVFALWDDRVYAPAFDQPDDVQSNERVRAVLCTHFDAVEPLRVFTQPDGAPLFQLWTGTFRPEPFVSNAAPCVRDANHAAPRARVPGELW